MAPRLGSVDAFDFTEGKDTLVFRTMCRRWKPRSPHDVIRLFLVAHGRIFPSAWQYFPFVMGPFQLSQHFDTSTSSSNGLAEETAPFSIQ